MSLQDELRASRVGAPPVRPPRRWDLVAAWVVILGPVLGVAIWLGLRQRVGDLQERLVRDASATFSRPLARPVHVDAPSPGTFGEAVARHLPAIQRWADAVKDDAKARDAAREVVRGQRPFSELPAPYRVALTDLATHLDGLLAGTRAGVAELAPRPEAWKPCDGADWIGYQAAALLAGLRVRGLMATGDPGAALSSCLDGLALGRDAAIAGGLIGHMTGAAVLRRLGPPCEATLARLTPSAQAPALERVRAIRDAVPSVAEMLRVEFLGSELRGMGSLLPEEALRRLPPRALAEVREGGGLPGWERLAARDAWRRTRATWDALLRIAERNRGLARDAGFAGVRLEAERRINPLVTLATQVEWAKYARRAEAAIHRLDAMVAARAAAAFREQERRWPASIGELAARGLLTSAEAERLAEARLASPGAQGELELRLAFDTGDEKEPREEWIRRVRPPGHGGGR